MYCFFVTNIRLKLAFDCKAETHFYNNYPFISRYLDIVISSIIL